MKKFISIFVLALICLFGLFACGSNNEGGKQNGEGEGSGNEPQALSKELSDAKNYLKGIYEKYPTNTSSDYTRPAVGEGYTITWSVDTDKISVVLNPDGKSYTIDVNEESEEDLSYKLTATIKLANGEQTELSWNYVVPKFQVATWEEYVAAKAGDPIAVEGVVTAIIGKANDNNSNCLYLQDKENKGAYYVYGTAADPSAADSGIKVGMTVRATGEKDIYNGTHEIKNGAFKVVDETIKTIEPIDYTELFTNAKDAKDASITAAQGLLVTVKGVTIDSVTETNGYYNFKLAGKESYIRISSSVCPLSKADQKTFINNFKAHIGYTANATGVICVYDGNFYLTPVSVDAFEYLSLPVLDDAGMVAFEKDHLTLVDKVEEAKSVNLPTKGAGYEAVTIAWASSNEKVAKIEEGKVTFILPDETTEVTLTATLTSGEVTDTKEIKVTVVAPTFKTLTSAEFATIFELADGGAFTEKRALAGTIVSIDTEYNEGYNNITVTIKPELATDDEHNLQCYRMKGGAGLAVGDLIVVNGILKNYKGKFEFDAGCTYVLVTSGDAAAAALAAAYALTDGNALDGEQTLAGTIVKIDTEYNASYNNITVTIKLDCATDDEHNLQCYRMKGGDGLAVGDRIVVTGKVKNYKGTVEFDAGAKYIKLEK